VTNCKTIITRARLAGRLQAAGYEVRKIPNLYDATRPAWEVELDSVSADIIASYYEKVGKVVPAAGSGLPSVGYNREYTPFMYRVENPDGIGPVSGSGAGIGGAVGSDMGKRSSTYRYLMYYKGTGIGAAVLYNAKNYKVASFGFPLETTDNLDALLKATLSLF
jgi:hypothetical protein